MSSLDSLLLSVEKSVHLNLNTSVGDNGHLRFWDMLFSNLNYSFDAVYQVIDSILTAKDRCQIASLYIQAIAINHSVFLVSNVGCFPNFKLTLVGNRWLLGNCSTCALTVPHPTVDTYHVLIGSDSIGSYYLIDLGSRAGTRLNRRPVTPHKRRTLRNGDMIEVGRQLIEFFVDTFDPLDTSDHSGTG
jgi:hypothetical protein